MTKQAKAGGMETSGKRAEAQKAVVNSPKKGLIVPTNSRPPKRSKAFCKKDESASLHVFVLISILKGFSPKRDEFRQIPETVRLFEYDVC